MVEERLRDCHPMTAPLAQDKLRIDVWSDVICPFCWIGRHRLQAAIQRSGLADRVEVVHRAFELDPRGERKGPVAEYLAGRYGGEAQARALMARTEAMARADGLPMDLSRALFAPTLDAHRVILAAQAHGSGDAVMDRIQRAHFAEALDVSEPATLTRLAAEAGFAGAPEVLASRAYERDVRSDQAEAQGYGIGGVPFFILAGRYGVSGAQSVATFEAALRQAMERA